MIFCLFLIPFCFVVGFFARPFGHFHQSQWCPLSQFLQCGVVFETAFLHTIDTSLDALDEGTEGFAVQIGEKGLAC
jgi:hypothetical protein